MVTASPRVDQNHSLIPRVSERTADSGFHDIGSRWAQWAGRKDNLAAHVETLLGREPGSLRTPDQLRAGISEAVNKYDIGKPGGPRNLKEAMEQVQRGLHASGLAAGNVQRFADGMGGRNTRAAATALRKARLPAGAPAEPLRATLERPAQVNASAPQARAAQVKGQPSEERAILNDPAALLSLAQRAHDLTIPRQRNSDGELYTHADDIARAQRDAQHAQGVYDRALLTVAKSYRGGPAALAEYATSREQSELGIAISARWIRELRGRGDTAGEAKFRAPLDDLFGAETINKEVEDQLARHAARAAAPQG